MLTALDRGVTYFGLHGSRPLRAQLQDHLHDAEVGCDLLQKTSGCLRPRTSFS